MPTGVLSMERISQSLDLEKSRERGKFLKCLALIEQGLSGAVWFICIFSLNPTIYEALSLSLCLPPPMCVV